MLTNFLSSRNIFSSRPVLAGAGVIATGGLILNLFFWPSPWLGGLALGLYLFSISRWIGHRFSFPIFFQIFLGLFILLGIIAISNTVIYYSYQINSSTTAGILLATLFLFFLPRSEPIIEPTKANPLSPGQWFLLASFFILILSLFSFIWSARTTDLLPSPWLNFPPTFFLIYALTTIVLISFIIKNKKIWLNLVLLMSYFALGYLLAIIVYPLGYGFDGLIHRATENWILANGQIFPREPFYLGQYGLIVFLAQISNLPIYIFDVLLIPLLAISGLPTITHLGLTQGGKIPERLVSALTLIFPLCFFLPFHLTTPHNLALLLLIFVIFLTLSASHRLLPFWVPLLFAIWAGLTHPLLGGPAILFVLLTWTLKKLPHYWGRFAITSFYWLILVFLPTLLFSLRLWLNTHHWPQLTNPFADYWDFLLLFSRPYWYAKNAPAIFEALYTWQIILIIILLIVAGIGWLRAHLTNRRFPLLLTTSLALFLSAYFLHVWIVFPGVNNAEQGNYPWRLIIGAFVFLLPYLAYGIYHLISILRNWYQNQKKIVQIITTMIGLMSIAGILMVSLYFSYPQHNPKVYFPGYNITTADQTAVHWIQADNKELNYVVLSNSLTAVAALTEYSFARYFPTPAGAVFYYSIPTGGPLYRLYERMLYEGQKKIFMDEAMDLVGVKKSYFVVSHFWQDFEKIIAGAKKTANSWQIINNGEIYIFTYLR
ncbi:MAG TPA: hypothetical protein VJB37_02310 [Patescibacteria group bacterium]|nr:hypothetical protein [Patescibacteria group bacterium]